MDDFEKRVIKKKRTVLEQLLRSNKEMVTKFQEIGLIDAAVAHQFMEDKTRTNAVNASSTRLVDSLILSQVEGAFVIFCSSLLKSIEHAGLAKDLQADVKVERGSLVLDDDVMREAAMLVHRKFGQSRRMSEVEKREVQELLATKVQIVKEDFKQEMDTLRDVIDNKNQQLDERDSLANSIDKQLQKFIKDNDKQLQSGAHDMTSTSDALRSSVTDNDALGMIRFRMRSFFERVKVALSERELMQQDRDKCLEVLGPNAKMDQPLFDQIQARDDDAPAVEAKLRADLQSKERANQRLRAIVEELEAESEAKEKVVKEQQEQLEKDKEHMAALRAMVDIERQKLKDLASAQVESVPPPLRKPSASTREKTGINKR